MITIEKTETCGWEAAIRGMRNPRNSWDKIDSYPAVNCKKCGKIEREGCCKKEDRDCTHFKEYELGPKDYRLMKILSKSGSDHRKFMRMLIVYCDITAPLYWWKQFDTYKIGTVSNSCSTMNKIQDKEFTIDDFSHAHLDVRTIKILQDIVDALNDYRSLYINYNPADFEVQGCPSKKDIWWQMIELLPSSYNQKRTVMLNYEVLSNIYNSRKKHKLDEWRDFCSWIKDLPYSDIITNQNSLLCIYNSL